MSRTFFLKGKITLGDDTMRMSRVEVIVRKIEGYVFPRVYDGLIRPPFVEGRPDLTEKTLKVDRTDGTFECACETPHGPVEIVVTSPAGVQVRLVTPVPDERRHSM